MNDILDKASRNDGFTVPEGYFEDFAARMEARLPRQEWEDAAEGKAAVVPRSWWQKVRPYVYMAAMFMGVWMMMHVFDLMRSSQGLGVENSAILADAIDNEQFMGEYLASQGLYEDDLLYDDLFNDGFTPASYTSDY
ncbi:MAG: hypothetical protein K2H83_05180 [Duncaniella sp.]|nr:hypothetical protein [Duncaniella sp.]MDE5734520.1 hypothetical protein [Duncaniella sp.]MDE6391632.1 hypothetical protein [Duncaniella sp.]